MRALRWNAIILAASRGPEDRLAKAYGIANKCTLEIGGIPMLARVASALEESGAIASVLVSIEAPHVAFSLLGEKIAATSSAASAPASVIAAIEQGMLAYPVLITTGDHALLTPAMVRHFCQHTEQSAADFTVGIATAETVLAAYPQTARTFFRLAKTRLSGCNLYGLCNERGLKLLEWWQYLEPVRKKPWRLVATFGAMALMRFLTRRLDIDSALAIVSRKLGLQVKAIVMPFAEAAIDVDKPADKELAEEILRKRS